MKQKIPSKRGNPLLFFKILLMAILVLLNLGSNALIAGQPKSVTITIKRAPLSKVLNQVKNLPGVKMLFSLNTVKNCECGDFSFENVTVEEVLDQVLNGTGLSYEKVDGVLLIKEVPRTEQAQKKIIKGRVIDNKRQPLAGVTVMVKGTKTGSITDIDGRYTINIPEIVNPILVFSFIGLENKEIKISSIADEDILKGEREYVVTLVESIESLDDVVVTGYVNVRKESYTGNAVRVSGEQIKQVASRNVISVLQVFDPSFRVMENNAMGSNPNAIPEFYIRGQSGIANLELEDISEVRIKNNPNLPIFILDGLAVSVEKVYDMDPDRIHSITILKDAAATAVYGSRASNGVIVIETVAPKAGVFNVSYNLMGSVTAPDLSSYDYFDAREKLEVEKLAGYYIVDPTNSQKGVRNVYSELTKKEMAIAKGVNTDWLALPLRVGYNHKHSISIDGGNDNIRYGVNLLYDQQKGVMKQDYRNRLGTELRLDYRLENISVH